MASLFLVNEPQTSAVAPNYHHGFFPALNICGNGCFRPNALHTLNTQNTLINLNTQNALNTIKCPKYPEYPLNPKPRSCSDLRPGLEDTSVVLRRARPVPASAPNFTRNFDIRHPTRSAPKKVPEPSEGLEGAEFRPCGWKLRVRCSFENP